MPPAKEGRAHGRGDRFGRRAPQGKQNWRILVVFDRGFMVDITRVDGG